MKCAECGKANKIRKYRRVCMKCESRHAVEWAKNNRDKKRKANNRYHAKISAERAMRTRLYRTRHPSAYAAHKAVQTALRNGTMVKRSCVICGSRKTHAHHEDYSKPLQVVWLCHAHHMERHAP